MKREPWMLLSNWRLCAARPIKRKWDREKGTGSGKKCSKETILGTTVALKRTTGTGGALLIGGGPLLK